MYLRGGRGKCGLGILLVLMQCVCGQGDEDFQEYLFCPTNSLNRVLLCPDGEVIDIQQVRVANLWAMGIETNPCSDLSSKSAITDIYHPKCKQDLSLLSCHGKQSCIVTRTMAEVWLPECQKDVWNDQPGRLSDVLYVRYVCFKPTTTNSGDAVNMTIAYTDNLSTTTTTTTTTTEAMATTSKTETMATTTPSKTSSVVKIMTASIVPIGNSRNDGVIIGSVLGVLLLIVLVALIVVIVMYKKKHERKEKATAAPSGDVYSDTTSGELNNGGNNSGYVNAFGPQKPYENVPRTYISILEDNDANTTTDRGPNNVDPGDYDYIKVVDNRNRFNNVGTNGDEKYDDLSTVTMETKNDKYEDLLTATRDTKQTEPYEELSIAAK